MSFPRVSNDEVSERFAHHAPSSDHIIEAHQTVRETFTQVAVLLNDNLAEGREKSAALTALQEAAMWANASVAINQEWDGVSE